MLCSHPEIMRWVGGAAYTATSLDQAGQWLRERPLADYAQYGFGRLACVHKVDGKVIGFAGLKFEPFLDEIDLGYRFLPPYWGQGLATGAGRAVIDDGFGRLGLNRIIGLAHLDNRASARVLQKLGLRFDGLMEYAGLPHERYVIERASLS